MATNNYIKYYNGEKESPFVEDIQKSSVWDIEKTFQQLPTDNPAITTAIVEYREVGLSDFSDNDGIPFPYKAFLFNRFCKYSSAPIVHLIKEFKVYYSNLYL